MNFPSLLSFAAAALSAATVLAAALRARRRVADWAFIAGAALVAAERLCSGFSLREGIEAGPWLRGQLVLAGLTITPWLVWALSYARGNAPVFLKRSTWVLAGSVVVPALLSLAFRRHLVVGTDLIDGERLVRLGWAGVGLHVFVVVAAVLVLMQLERTFRAAIGTLRWRIKFVLLGVGVLYLVRAYTASQGVMFRGVSTPLEMVNSVGVMVALMVTVRGLLRSSEFPTDVYPSLSVLSGSLTLAVAGVYLLVVGVLGKIATRLGGDASFAFKAFLVLLTLVGFVILLQSDRVRLQIRRYLSRNFQRPIYDYRMIWSRFSESTASCVEQTDLCRSVVRTTADIFQALAVSIWLVTEHRDSLVLAASTAVADAKARESAPSAAATQEIVRFLQRRGEPVDFETVDAPWAAALRRCHPTEFPNGGSRICVPLLRQKQLVGVLLLGDRVSGVAFPIQEHDLLKCIADHVTFSLRNIQMSQQLLQTKELEAFQTMAAFFVHDLKNAAWTLNLMLQNLPVHFDNPEFRADALRAIGKTVSHINHLTSRLGALRHELKITPAERDLNEVVQAALAGLNQAKPEVIVRDLKPVPKTLVDQEQLQKVIVNLVLNAIEASPAHGRVRVATRQNDGWIVLDVSDDGCGMSEEFIRRSLFRPFQTTKKHGLGIGMFQSRMIVEAHGGRIHASSRVGQGSTFQISLPIRSQTE